MKSIFSSCLRKTIILISFCFTSTVIFGDIIQSGAFSPIEPNMVFEGENSEKSVSAVAKSFYSYSEIGSTVTIRRINHSQAWGFVMEKGVTVDVEFNITSGGTYGLNVYCVPKTYNQLNSALPNGNVWPTEIRKYTTGFQMGDTKSFKIEVSCISEYEGSKTYVVTKNGNERARFSVAGGQFFIVAFLDGGGATNYDYNLGYTIRVKKTSTPTVTPTLFPPQMVFASQGDYSDKILVGWSSISEGYDSPLYKVYRSESLSGTKILIGETSEYTYEDTTAVYGKTYYYWIKGVNGDKESEYSTWEAYGWLGESNLWTVSFNANGGSGSMSSQTFSNGTSQKLSANAFTRSGYEFIGWATSASGSVVYSDQQSISLSANKTLYAVWKVIDGAFDLRFGTPSSRSWKQGFFLNNISNGVSVMRSFLEGEKIYRNSFFCNVGSESLTDDFEILHEILNANGSVRCSYVESETSTYNPNKGYIRENKEWVAGLGNLPAGSYVYRYTIDVNNDVPESNESNNIFEYSFSIIDEYTVTFDTCGGSSVDCVSIPLGLALGTLPVPERDGYTFLGWFTAAEGGEQITESTVVTGDVTYYAQWEEEGSGDGGEEYTPASLFEYGVQDGGIVIKKYIGKDTVVNIPPFIDGAPVVSIGENAFDGCSGLTSVTIPDSVTSIGYSAFWGCSGLTSVTIGNSVTSIGIYAFYGCSGLTSITIPNSVTRIGDFAFLDCDGLKSVTIPDSVTSIGERAFYWCRNLKSAIFLGDAPRNVGDYIFDDCAGDFVIKVKKGTKGWNGDYTSTALPTTWHGYPIAYDTESELNVTYNVAFNANGGSGSMAVQTIACNTSTKLRANAFNRTGYTFQGWAKSKTGTVVYKDGVSVKNLATSGTVTLYAVWKPNTYKVVFNANGGSGSMAAQTIACNTWTKLRANAFNRTGYTFQGWAKSKTGTVVYKDGVSVKNLATSGTVTLYAVWKPNTYKVVFNANGGSGSMAAQSMTYNKAAYLNNNAFKRTGYTFLGWAKSPTGAVAYKNAASVKKLSASGATIKLYAKWAKTKYKIAFYANGGKGTMSAQTMIYNKAAYLKKNTFKRTGYTFQGWAKTKTGSVVYTNGKAVKNLTTTGGTVKLYAKWKPITYKVVFYGYGGKGSMSAQTIPVNKAAYLKKNAFKRTGYTFLGWAKSAALAKKGKIAYKNCQVVKNLLKKSGTVKLIAVWKPITYKVVFYPNGGSGKAIAQSMTYNKAAYLKKNIYKRSGYIFLGWAKSKNGAVAYKNAQAVKNLRSTAGTITLYAKWAKPSYKVAFYANGGSGSMSSQSMTYNKAAYLKKNAFKRTGYTFAGWAKSSTGSVVYSNGKAVKNLTTTGGTVKLYAVWKPIPYNVNGYNGVQLWEGGPYWAETNIGAENPEDYGYYFWWGDTIGYKRVNDKWVASDGSSSNFSFYDYNIPTYDKYYSELQSEGWITSNGVLAPEHDAARAHCGSNWRMPTYSELQALCDNCRWTWTTKNGVYGYEVRGKGNYSGASIFLPAAGYGYGTSLYLAGSNGYYWSSVPLSDSDYYSWGLYFNSSYHDASTYYDRYTGLPVRPVLDVH